MVKLTMREELKLEVIQRVMDNLRFLVTHLNTRKLHLNLNTIISHSFLWFQEKDSQ
jgi:hypothetical protein